MTSPKVSVVMLMSPGREEMAVRALKCVEHQTYRNVELLAVGTADMRDKTIGYMRNVANQMATGDLIAHFDDDDWSHPRRLEEQVALLEDTGKQVVGYRELLFWDTRFPGTEAVRCPAENHPVFVRPSGSIVAHYNSHHSTCGASETQYGEAWIYRNPDPRWAAGASFLYRREFWAQHPFPDAPHEDQRWWLEHASVECVGTTLSYDEPRMICQMHAGGTEQIPRKVMLEGGGGVWRRAPEFDRHCAERMAL